MSRPWQLCPACVRKIISLPNSMPPRSRALAESGQLAENLRPVILRLARRLRRTAHWVGVSALDAHLLGVLARNAGIGVSEMAEREQITKPAMSAHMNRLVQAGWVVRTPAPNDKRRVVLALTRAGRLALQEMRRESNDWLAERMAQLTAAELQALKRAIEPLGKLVDDGA